MGFFLSRKPSADQNDGKSVIRSRFYPKQRKDAATNPESHYNYSSGFVQKPPPQMTTKHEPCRTQHPSHSQWPSVHPNTATLARQLNELAIANSEGLLDSDEYRVLRQNLFERFAVAPVETPVIPATGSLSNRRSSHSSTSRIHHSPTVHTTPLRTPSILSKTSVSSTLSDFLRGSTRRNARCASNHSVMDESSSIFSANSRSSVFLVKSIFRRKRSSSSIRTDMSQVPVDTITIPSRRPGNVFDRQFHVPYHPSLTVGGSRAQPAKLLSTPPSSFPVRFFAPGGISSLYDDENLSTVEDIRQEILAVEMEASRISEVFNDLELNASSSSQRMHHFPPPGPIMQPQKERDDIVDSAWAVVPEHRPYGHQDSGVLDVGAPSSMTPTRHAGLTTFGEMDSNGSSGNVADIRKQRADVIGRYDARLDYLWAKLKSAQLHEKVLK